jgi:hypothetical protein
MPTNDHRLGKHWPRTQGQLDQISRSLVATAPYIKAGGQTDPWGFMRGPSKDGICIKYRCPDMSKTVATAESVDECFLCAKCGQHMFDHGDVTPASTPKEDKFEKELEKRRLAAANTRAAAEPTLPKGDGRSNPTFTGMPTIDVDPDRDPGMLDDLSDPLAIAGGAVPKPKPKARPAPPPPPPFAAPSPAAPTRDMSQMTNEDFKAEVDRMMKTLPRLPPNENEAFKLEV